MSHDVIMIHFKYCNWETEFNILGLRELKFYIDQVDVTGGRKGKAMGPLEFYNSQIVYEIIQTSVS